MAKLSTSAPAESQSDASQTGDDEALEDDSFVPPTAVAPAAAPAWLNDFRNSEYQTGFYRSLPNYALHFVQRSPERLIVSFDNLSSARDNPVDRNSWGYGFIRKNGWSHLGVMAFEPSWYRSNAVFAELEALARDGFFRRFSHVTMIGTSMGAYAATAFASLVPGCGVVAFSPQSTLSKGLVPWEKRFSSGRKADWSGRYADGAQESQAAARVWIIFDPGLEEDTRHAKRYNGKNVTMLRARYAGHKTALFLRRAELLSTVVSEAVAGTLSEQRFYALYRRGRDLPWYLNGVADRVAGSSSPHRIKKMPEIVAKLGRPNVARLIATRHSQLITPDLLSR